MRGRRFATVPGIIVAWLVWVAAIPIALPLAALVDALRGVPWVAARSVLFLAFFLSCEVVGLAAAGAVGLWSRSLGMEPDRWDDIHFRLEAWWGATLFRGVVQVFGLRVEVDDRARLGTGPLLLLLRHASSADTLIASALVSRRHGLRLRYVLKKELLWDPCLDIVGNRLPNVFVDRAADDSTAEIERVRVLAEDLGPRDGVLIYPEGTRFSEAKRARILEGLGARGDIVLLDYAQSLSRVLPPRAGGTLALLEAAPDADVVIGAHTGFEGAASMGQMWRGDLVHQTVRIQFRRVDRADIPDGGAARMEWLRDEWRRVDDWLLRS